MSMNEIYTPAANGKDGLLIDVRSNGGGFTTDLLLASIMVKPHAYTIPRGGEKGYPRDRLYIQRYTQPINMLCNERSFSNAEIISHAFKTLGRGTLIGNQTYGGVISTGKCPPHRRHLRPHAIPRLVPPRRHRHGK